MSAPPSIARMASEITGVHVQYISSREAASAKGPFTYGDFLADVVGLKARLGELGVTPDQMDALMAKLG